MCTVTVPSLSNTVVPFPGETIAIHGEPQSRAEILCIHGVTAGASATAIISAMAYRYVRFFIESVL